MLLSHLFEYDMSKTLANFEKALGERTKDSHLDIEAMFRRNNVPDGPITVHEPNYGKWALAMIEEADPTKQKSFVVPLCRWYISKQIRYLEDLPRATEALNHFIKYKNRLKGIDLRTISFEAFEGKMDEMSKTLSRSEMWKEEENRFYQDNQAELIRNDSDVKIVVPKSREAAIFFGKHTKWCTSMTVGDAFETYTQRGPLYIALFKRANVRWQFHFGESQFMNELDHPLDLEEIWKSPVGEWFNDQIRDSLSLQPHNIKFLSNPTFEELWTAIEADGGLLYYCDNFKLPEDFYQRLLHRCAKLHEFGSNGYDHTAKVAFKEIHPKSLDDCRTILKIDGDLIGECINHPEARQNRQIRNELVELAVDTNGGALIYWRGPVSDELALRAIKTDQSAYRHLIDNYDHTPDGVPEALQIKAVQQNAMAVQQVRPTSERVAHEAISTDPRAIYYIEKPSMAACQFAVKRMLALNFPQDFKFGHYFEHLPAQVLADPTFQRWVVHQLEHELSTKQLSQRISGAFKMYMQTFSPKVFALC